MNLLDQYNLPKYNDSYGSIATPIISSGLETIEEYNYSTDVPYKYTDEQMNTYTNVSMGLLGVILILGVYISILLSRIQILKSTINNCESMIETLHSIIDKTAKT